MSTAIVHGVPEGFDAVLLARRAAEATRTLVHVCRDDQRMARLSDALAFFAPSVERLRFPAWDCLPYDRVSPNAEIVSERIATLARLLEPASGARIVLTTVNALVQRVPPRHVFRNSSRSIAVNSTFKTEEVARFLEANGYGRSATVMEPGEFAIRGGIFDIFAAGQPEPVRIDLFGDTVESIRPFDPATQRSGKAKLTELMLRPVNEVFLDRDSITRFRTGWRDLFSDAAATDPVYLSISDGRRHPGMEHWVPLFHDTMEVLLDYTGVGTSVSLDHQSEDVLANRLEMVADHYAARHGVVREGETPYRPLPAPLLYLDRAEWDEMLSFGPLFTFSPFAQVENAAGIEAGGRPAPVFSHAAGIDVFEQARPQFETWISRGKRPVVAAWSRGSRERIGHLLAEHKVRAEAADDLAALQKLPAGMVGLIVLGLERGFVSDTMAVVSEQDLLGERIARPPRKRKRADQFIAEATEIAEGDLVVHQDHGIGRYDGLITLHVSGAAHDCLRLLYEGEQKLFLPVENIEMLSRFGSEGSGVALDKLGGASWQTRKAKMKQRIRDMAGELIRTAAARRMRDAEMMTPAEGEWDEFLRPASRFAETEDQARAIADVLEDLAAGKPMDRLICGDVGFGKTEVALRAAFVAAMSGSQVAVVVPTTLLSRQHFRVSRRASRGLSVKVAQLSRMVTAKEARKCAWGLRTATSTSSSARTRLLAENGDVRLARARDRRRGAAFRGRAQGTAQGAEGRRARADADRDADPAHAAVGADGRARDEHHRDAAGRSARGADVHHAVDAVVIREALQRERFRGGQVFLRRAAASRIWTGWRNGCATSCRKRDWCRRTDGLSPTELERVMTEFGDGKYDILLSTNIVESGLDMPAVNTLVIYRADMFGLGQLYQLRGRVGRGKQRGYAYLTWPQAHRLSAAAEKRLHVMQTLDQLGAGFTLASHDLDIRGAGNLLGDEQSGHIREVGIELYQQMLEDAVAEMRAEKGRRRADDREWTPSIGLGLPVLIRRPYGCARPASGCVGFRRRHRCICSSRRRSPAR